MAGIGQSSVPLSDHSSLWNSQYTMGRSTTVDNYSNNPNDFFPITDKRRLIPEDNGASSQIMYQYNRQSTHNNSNLNDKNSLSNNMSSHLPTSVSSGNYNLYQRTRTGDSSMYDVSSQSKQTFSANMTRLGGMSQFLESSNHSYLSSATQRPINPLFNGQSIPKNRPITYTPDNQSLSFANQWDTQIGHFDSSEFPSLKTKQMSSSSTVGNYQYAMSSRSHNQINFQLVTKTGVPIITGEQNSEFSILQEDFPALPVAHNPTVNSEYQHSSSVPGINSITDNSIQSQTTPQSLPNDLFLTQKSYSTNGLVDYPDQNTPLLPSPSHSFLSSASSSLPVTVLSQTPTQAPKKITLGPNHSVFNIPNDMVADAFGLIGLVKLLSINDTYEHLHLLAPGVQTVALNKELDSSRDIYQSYVSPLSSNCAGRPHDIDYPVPKEYRIRHLLMARLADPLPDKLSDETLFWIFYNLTGEECQLTAAKQLMIRQWRYHKKERFWLTRDPNGKEPVTHLSFELGSYIVWDVEKAKKVYKHLTVYYKDLDNVTLPSSSLLSMKLQLPFCAGAQLKRGSSSLAGMIPGPSRSRTMAALLSGAVGGVGGSGGGVTDMFDDSSLPAQCLPTTDH